MISLFRAFHAELLKLKRTLALWMIFVSPLLVATLLFFILLDKSSKGAPFDVWSVVKIALNMWAVFMLPLLITLETSLLNGIDHGEKNWKHIFSLAIPRHAVYAAKFIIGQLLAAGSTIFLVILSIILGLVFMKLRPALANAGPVPYGWFLKNAAMVWLASWMITAIHTWISIRWATFTISLGAGIGGTFFALFAAGARFGKYYPWLFPVNSLSANRMVAALWIGALGGLIVAIIACVDLVRRDVA